MWGVRVYLKTNIAKYLPGNVWHFYGRVSAAKDVGIPATVGTLSVVMEPLLMAAAALLIASVSNPQANLGLQLPILAAVLIGVHPKVFNPLLQQVSKLKGKAKGTIPAENQIIRVKRYPILPLLGELGFIGLRGAGFLLTMLAFRSLSPVESLLVFSAFSWSWLLGFVIPGAPGGIGVFEATALALLNGHFSSGVVLSAVALYRLISTLAEAVGAGLAWLSESWSNGSSNTHS
jgi:hypothetical protein